jgi:hypothetical protein
MVGGWKFMETAKIAAEEASGISGFTSRRARLPQTRAGGGQPPDEMIQ